MKLRLANLISGIVYESKEFKINDMNQIQLDENDSSTQKSANRSIKSLILKACGKDPNQPGATLHHLNAKLDKQDKLAFTQDRKTNKDKNYDGMVVITGSTRDSDFINKLIHFCVRNDISLEDIWKAIDNIDIYGYNPNVAQFGKISLNEVIELSRQYTKFDKR